MDSMKVFILSGWLLVLIGCHNNAHLRTQKILKKKESVLSVSGVLPLGGIKDNYYVDDENGVLGIRGELSYIKGFGNYELGPYAGFGLSDFEDPGFILGFDYKNYLNIFSNKSTYGSDWNTIPVKFGAQFELNLSEYGQTFHIKPSLSTVTNQEKAGYFGVHGLLYNGNLKLLRDPFLYNYSSLGIGFTIGTEYISSKLSMQVQADLSMVNNAFQFKDGDINFDKLYRFDDYGEEWYFDPGNDYYLLVGLSAGLNFLNAPEVGNKLFEPMPVPNYKKVKTKDIHYDPNTGEAISPGANKFDPETGELQSAQVEIFDPSTGEKIIQSKEKFSGSNDPSNHKTNSNKSLTDSDVLDLAYSHGIRDYVSPLWTLLGIASIPAAFVGSIGGAIISFEIMDLDEIGFIGPIIGGIAGLSIPHVLLKNTDVKITYPSNITDNKQINIYKAAYSEKIKGRRAKKVIVSQSTCIIGPLTGLLAGIIIVGL